MNRFLLLIGVPVLPILLAACTGGGLYGSGPTATPPLSVNTNASTPTAEGSPASVDVADDARLGPIFVSPAGLTLYYFVPERGGTIVCTGTCTTYWPPALAQSGSAQPAVRAGVTGQLSVIARPGGAAQLSYNGWPLYTFSGDKAAGDTKGQGIVAFGGTWFVATPDLES